MTDKKADFGMTGNEIFRAFHESMGIAPENASILSEFSHMQMLWLHARALSAHCECLGMNAENSIAVCKGSRPPFSDIDYDNTLEKWGLTDEEGKPII